MEDSSYDPKKQESVYGHIYQLKLLMLFLWRGISFNYSFKLKTEIEEMKTFDDLVFEVKKRDKKQYRLFQAKHALRNDEIITVDRLFQIDGHYDLPQCYYSYLNSKKLFPEDSIKDAIVCTNIGLDLDDLNKAEIEVKEIRSQDDILDTQVLGTRPKRYKFISNSTTVGLLKQKVQERLTRTMSKPLESWAKDAVLDENIKDFLDHLVFSVNQPNELELEEIVKNEIGNDFIMAKIVYDKSYHAVLNWLQNKEKGKVLSPEEGKEFFKEIKQILAKLQPTALSFEHLDIIEKLGIEFNEEIQGLRSFLSSDKQIVNLINPHNTVLSSIKTYQMLKSEYGEFIFVHLKSLSSRHIQDRIVQSLCNLLVVECDATGDDVDRLFNIVGNKKIILLTLKNSPVVEKLKCKFAGTVKYEEITDEQNGLTDLTIRSQEKLLEKKVLFQGYEISLDELIDDASKHLIDGEVISKLIDDDMMEVGLAICGLREIEKNYIDRRFSCQVKIQPQCFEERNIRDLFAVSNIDKDELSSLACGQKVCKFKDMYLDGHSPVRFMVFDETDQGYWTLEEWYEGHDKQSIDKWGVFKGCIGERSVHRVKRKNDEIVWQKSYGTLSNLRKFIDTSSCNVYQARDLNNIAGNLIIISADPGMGKSTALTKVAQDIKKAVPSCWVLPINLNDCIRKLDQIRFEENVNEVIDFLSDIIGLRTVFEKGLFEYKVKSQGNITLLFDGFDEISPIHQGRVSKLLEILKTTKVQKVWITTRPSMKSELEDKFSVLSYTLMPFSEEEQNTFLKSLLPDDINNHIGVLSNSIANTGTPLHTMMLAECFQLKSGKLRPELPETLDVLDLYEQFIQNKYYIYCREREKEDFIKRHQLSGLSLLFSVQCISALLPQEDFKVLMNDLKGGNETVFIHRTFAEYFAASWLAENRHEDKVKRLLRNEFFEDRNVLLRNFFDRLLARGQLNVAVLNGDELIVDQLQTQGLKIEASDDGGRNALHIAAAYGRLQIAQTLLKHGFDFYTKDELLGWTPLTYARKGGNWSTVEFLLQKGANGDEMFEDINDYVDKERRSLLHVAVCGGYMKLMKTLVERGANLRAVDYLMRTPLHYAAEQARFDAVQYLVDHGAELNEKDVMEKTPLHYVIEKMTDSSKHGNVVRCLVEHGADVQIADEYAKTPLHLAVEFKQFDCVKYLSDKGADIDKADEYGKTPLHVAVEYKQFQIVKYLLEKGADLHKEDERVRTPLHIAVELKLFEIVKYLIDKGANIRNIDDQRSPLYIAVELGEFEMVKYLVEQGAELQVRDCHYKTPLHKAIQRKDLKVVEILVEGGAGIQETDLLKVTPLHMAALFGNLEIVKYLIRKGADLRNLDYERKTPFHLAVGYNELEVVKCLIENGAELEKADRCEMTPLQIAVESNNLEVIKYLVELGADLQRVDGGGRTLLHIAVSESMNLEVIKYLVEKGVDVEKVDRYKRTALERAVAAKNLEVVKYLAEKSSEMKLRLLTP